MMEECPLPQDAQTIAVFMRTQIAYFAIFTAPLSDMIFAD